MYLLKQSRKLVYLQRTLRTKYNKAFKKSTELYKKGKSTEIEYVLCSIKIFQVG